MPQSHLKLIIILLFSALVFLLSCRADNKGKELPPYVLDREAMIALITDIHLIEAALLTKQTHGILASELAEIYYDTLFAKHAVSRMQVDSSIAYYSRRPELFEEIYVQVVTNLSKKESEIQLKKANEIEDTLDQEAEDEGSHDTVVEEEIYTRIQKEKAL